MPSILMAVAIATGAYAIIAGGVSLLGWGLDIPRLTDWSNQGISMFPNAALCGLLAGAGLIIQVVVGRSLGFPCSRVFAGIVALIAGLTVYQHATGTNLGIDTLILERPWGQAAAAAPMRMGVPASTSFLMLGLGLMLATAGPRGRQATPILATLTLAIASLSLTGYWFGADQLFGIARITGISLLASTVVAALSVGVMASVPEFGPMAALGRDDAGGAVLRRLIVPMVVIPLVLGWGRVRGEEANLFDANFGTALRTLLEIAILFPLLWWTANNIRWHATSAQKANARLAAIIDSSEDAIVSKSLQGIIESWNAGAERTFGYTPQEALGKHITIIIPAERRDEENEILGKIGRGERIEHFETVRIRKDGVRLQISLTVSPVKDMSGKIIGISKIARDISDRKRAEERFRAVVEATPECVKIVAPDGTLEFMNRAGLCIIEAESEPVGRSACVFDLIAPDHRADWVERHARICAGERIHWEFEIVTLKGTRRWMESHAVPLRLPDGRIAQLAVTREISSRKQSELERESLLESERAARSEAERASHLKDEFLATLSHELRTPLNAILGWSHVLKRSSGQTDLQQGVEIIQRNARAQAQLIEDLLDMNRIISGKMRLDVQSTDLASVIAVALESIGPAAEAKGIRLQKILDPRAGLVSGDPTRLQQVVWNLLTNAIKFTPKGGKVDVILQRVNSHLEIVVHDTGIGISAEHLPIIFERFRQVDASTTRAYGGLGLGLSIAKQLVELHGGTITATSAGKGEGATFVVNLPIAPLQGSADRIHPNAATSSAFDHGQLDLAGVKVLVVDDDPDARTLIQRALSKFGAEVSTAGSAAQGLDQLRSFRPHVLVSDIGMPVTDGYQFMRDVRSLTETEGGRTPAIALTAFARSEDRMRAMLSGYQIHVAKPIEPQELAITVHSLARP